MKNQRFILWLLLLPFTQIVVGQNPQLAKKYFDDAEFDKAIYEYKLLVDKFPYQDSYVLALVKSYQAVKKYEEVNKLIKKLHPQRKPQLYVYIGYNYQLQKDSLNAKKYYQKAINLGAKKPQFVYSLGAAFQNFYLLDQALEVYKIAVKQHNKSNYYVQIAQIYAEKGDLDQMIANYLTLTEVNAAYESRIKYYLAQFITQDPEHKVNIILKNQLVERISQAPKTKWYRLLHWLYVQQKEYKKAFFQLKSLYRKNEAEISEIYHLAQTANYGKKQDEAIVIYRFVIDQATEDDVYYQELSKLALLKLDMSKILSPEFKQNIHKTFEQYRLADWSLKNKISLDLLYADFVAFHLKNPAKAIAILGDLEKMPMSKSVKASVLLKKADILLYNMRFSQALILYTQVQLDFPNNEIGHNATFKIAQASFFQGDIDWAHAQLKVVKSVSSDFIANDAIDLDLIIINNKEEADTLQLGLKKFAKAKFEIFRKNPKKSLIILDTLTQNFKGQLIYDDALWTRAQIFEQTKSFTNALQDYEAIQENKTEDLYKDDALYRMAEIYHLYLNNEMKAKELYKKIIIDYPASFWFVDARSNYRKLRGDSID